MNVHAIRAIYGFELARTWRTLMQSILSPVLSTSLYFIVFGGAIGSRMTSIDGVSYGAFIVPGLIMLSVLTESVSNSSFGIYMPRFSGTIYEVLSAPIAVTEIVLCYAGAAAAKSSGSQKARARSNTAGRASVWLAPPKYNAWRENPGAEPKTPDAPGTGKTVR
jgi:hypothetical protein